MKKPLEAKFFKTPMGNEPVRDWLKSLDQDDKKIVGSDIRTVQNGWPIGMPTCRHLRSGIYEVRSNLTQNKISRILFSVAIGAMYLLHGFIKKTEKTSKDDLALAISRKSEIDEATNGKEEEHGR